MLSTSQRQESAYTLTNRLMGDPRPDRFAIDEIVRRKIRYAPAMLDSVHRDSRVTAMQRCHWALEAVRNGCRTVEEISDKIGMSYRATGAHMTRARENCWVSAQIVAQPNSKHRVYFYTLTPGGFAELERVK